MFAEVNEAFRVVDIVVDNAAVYSFQPFEDITETEFRRQFDTNVLGSILVVHEYLRQVSRDGGSIIIISAAGVTIRHTWTGRRLRPSFPTMSRNRCWPGKCSAGQQATALLCRDDGLPIPLGVTA